MITSIHLHIGRKRRGLLDVISVKTGRDLVFYAGAVILDNVRFHINHNGRKRALREGRKNVHAWVKGALNTHRPDPIPDFLIPSRLYREAVYTPQSGAFVDRVTGRTVTDAYRVIMNGPKVYYR